MSDSIQPLGDTTLLVDKPIVIGSAPGITDVVPAFGSTAVHFDPTQTTAEAVAAWAEEQAGEASEIVASSSVEVPLLYGGEFVQDLESIAERAGLDIDGVIRRHSRAEYTVGAIGFQPGFPYLEGLPPELHTPRQETPRVRVPAGSVGIGGAYTGVYPHASPGGWNLIGRTPLLLFNEHRDESLGGPSLLRVGDRVRFRPIDAAEYERLANENRPTPPPTIGPPDRPLFRVISPGVQTTVQGLGRPGRQHLGIGPGGAMDTTSLRIANRLAGNAENTPAIEATLVGPVLECLAEVTIGLAGLDGVARRLRLSEGERLDLRSIRGGARAYLALPGGFTGHVGEALAGGAIVGTDEGQAVDRLNAEPDGRWAIRLDHLTPIGQPQTIRVLRGPQADRFDATDWKRFLSEPYKITPQSNRMGLRCEGEPLRPIDTDALPSQPVCHGVVQVPPDGQPIVLAADRQTLGGYPIIAVVASADWPRLGQLRPGDAIRFTEIDLPTAQTALRKSERDLSLIVMGIQLK